MGGLLLHWLRTLFRWIGLMVTVPILALALLLTPPGLKIGLAVVSRVIPGELHYQQVTGTLLGSFTVTRLSYRYQDQQFSASRLYLRWRPSALLAGKIAIATVNIDSLIVNTPQAPASAPQFSITAIQSTLYNIRPQLTALRVPVDVKIDHANIRSIVWQQHPGQPTMQATGVQVSGTAGPNTLKIKVKGQLVAPYSMQTDLAINGTPQQYQVALTAFNPKMHWMISGQVNPNEIQIDAQKALILGGELTAHLVWQWQAPMSWQLTMSGQHLDLSVLQPDLPQALEITLDTTGNLAKGRPHFSWNATLKTPQTQVATHGSDDRQWDIYWNLHIHQLAELLPFSSGSLASVGELHGSLTKPHTKGSLQAALLRWQGYRADTVNATWDVDISQSRSSFFQVTAEQLFTQWLEIQKIQLSGKGRWDQHELDATADGYHTNVQLALTGGFSPDHWQGSIQRFTIAEPGAGVWKLNQPSVLYLSAQRVEVTALCLQSAYQAQLCLHGQWQAADHSWQIAATSRLNLQQIAAWSPDALTLNLPVDLHVNATGIGEEIHQAQLTGTTQAGSIHINGPQDLDIQVKNAQVSATLDKTGMTANARAELADNNVLSAALTLPQATVTTLFANNQALRGKVSIAFNNLAPIEALIPDTVNPRGKFQADFTLDGTLGEPLVDGQAHIEGGEVKIPGLNIQLDQINLTLNAQGSLLSYTVTATSAHQPLKLVGQTRLNEAGFPTDVTLTGNTVLLADTPVYTVYVNPNIHVALKGRDITITGMVDIPKAILRKLEFQNETTLPEGEVVFIGESPVAKTTPWNINMQLTVNFGNDITVDDPAFKGKLGGSLVLISQPGQVMLGDGKIDITDGIYEVFGRQLTITPGSAILYRRNPISNPALNIQAVTRVIVTDAVSQQQLGTNEITVGMNIGGTSSSPQVTLFSSAGNLSQADMLSFLLLGTSSAGISPTNMNLMLQAVNNLPLTKKGVGGVQGLTNQVKQGLGLSELGVESEATLGPMGEAIPTTTPTSYFVVGKRLTSRIYFRYKYDPFNSVNLFQLNYLFSKNWSLQLETDGSTQSGADVLYTIDTGVSKSADKTAASH